MGLGADLSLSLHPRLADRPTHRRRRKRIRSKADHPARPDIRRILDKHQKPSALGVFNPDDAGGFLIRAELVRLAVLALRSISVIWTLDRSTFSRYTSSINAARRLAHPAANTAWLGFRVISRP